MKVYIVVSGEYSDKEIDAIFLDKEKAELFCAINNGEYDTYWNRRILTYDTDDYNTEGDPEIIKYVWNVSYYIPENKITAIDGPYIVNKSAVVPDSMRRVVYYDSLATTVVTSKKDEELAKKIFYDRLAKWKAEEYEKT